MEEPSTEASDQRRPQPLSDRKLREVEVIRSDRIELMSAANDLIRYLVEKQTLAVSPAHARLTKKEGATYSAALEYLRRQFETGHKDVDVVDKRVERDITFDD